MTKIRSICVDTLTALQTDEYMENQKKADLGKWMDWWPMVHLKLGEFREPPEVDNPDLSTILNE